MILIQELKEILENINADLDLISLDHLPENSIKLIDELFKMFPKGLPDNLKRLRDNKPTRNDSQNYKEDYLKDILLITEKISKAQSQSHLFAILNGKLSNDDVEFYADKLTEKSSTEDIENIFSAIPSSDIVFKEKIIKIVKQKTKVPIPQLRKLFTKIKRKDLISNEEEEEEDSSEWITIEDEKKANKDVNITLKKDGIYLIYISQQGIQESRVWTWDSFKILRVLEEPQEGDYIENYDFEWNGNFYEAMSLEDMINRMRPYCCPRSRNRDLLGALIKPYCILKNIERVPYSAVCGFTQEKGWTLPGPGGFHIKFTKSQKRFKKHILKMLEIDADPIQAKKFFKLLYDNLAIKNKDIDMAYAIIAPFLYALRDYTELMPFYSFGVETWDDGKTARQKIITNLFYNILGKYSVVINPDQIASKSRCLEIFSLSTFPIPIDDAQDLAEAPVHEVKIYLISESYFDRKNIKQEMEIAKPLTSPITLSWNEQPIWFKDRAFLSRGINDATSKKFSVEEIEKYNEIKQKIPCGYLGKRIIDYTKDFVIDDIIDMYNQVEVPSILKENRARKIYRLFGTGAILAKAIFDVELDISNLPSLIQETREIGSENIFSIIQTQIFDGRDILDETNDTIKKRRPTWINNEVKISEYNNSNGFAYTMANLQDLNNYIMRGQNNIKAASNLSNLYSQLKNRWPKIHHGNHTIEGRRIKSIFFPEDFKSFSTNNEQDKKKENDEKKKEKDEKFISKEKQVNLENKILKFIKKYNENTEGNWPNESQIHERFNFDNHDSFEIGSALEILLKSYKIRKELNLSGIPKYSIVKDEKN